MQGLIDRRILRSEESVSRERDASAQSTDTPSSGRNGLLALPMIVLIFCVTVATWGEAKVLAPEPLAGFLRLAYEALQLDLPRADRVTGVVLDTANEHGELFLAAVSVAGLVEGVDLAESGADDGAVRSCWLSGGREG